MSNFEKPGPVPSPAPASAPEQIAIEELRGALRSLRHLLNVVLLALIVLTVSLFGFIVRELKFVRRQVDENARLVGEYKQNVEPRLNELQAKLVAYSKTHPEFTPILIKYYGATNAMSGIGAGAQSGETPPSTGGLRSEPPPR